MDNATVLLNDRLPAAQALDELQAYLDHSIPLLSHMQVRVGELSSEHFSLVAPLEPNRNHIGTAFGGSLNSLAVLSGWSVIWLLLHARELDAAIVIHEGHMKFQRPASAGFEARCLLPAVEEMNRFIDSLARHGKARSTLQAEVFCENRKVGSFEGGFAATRKR